MMITVIILIRTTITVVLIIKINNMHVFWLIMK